MRVLSEIQRRAEIYLATYPEDEPAVSAITYSFHAGFNYQSAREAMELLAGEEIPESTWTEFGPRWKRAWNSIVGGNEIQTITSPIEYLG